MAIILLLVALLGLPCLTSAAIIFSADYESPATSEWPDYGGCCAQVSTTQASKGTKSMKTTMVSDATIPGSSPPKQQVRSEFSYWGAQPMNTIRWYGFAVWVDTTWQDDSGDPNGTIIAQWHQLYDAPEEGAHSPSLNLHITTGNVWRMRNCRDVNAISTASCPNVLDYNLGAVTKGAWTYFVVQYRRAIDSTGFLRVWKNQTATDTPLVNATGYNTFNDRGHIYWRNGMYKSWWGVTQPAPPDTLIIYHDDAKIGDHLATFADVDPTPGTPPVTEVPELHANLSYLQRSQPTLVRLVIDTKGNEPMVPASSANGFTCKVNGVSRTVNSAACGTLFTSYEGTRRGCTLTLASPITSEDDIVTCSYAQGPGNVFDSQVPAQELLAFTDAPIVNYYDQVFNRDNTTSVVSTTGDVGRPYDALFDGDYTTEAASWVVSEAAPATQTSIFNLGTAATLGTLFAGGDNSGTKQCETITLESDPTCTTTYTTRVSAQSCNIKQQFAYSIGDISAQCWRLTVADNRAGASTGTQLFEVDALVSPATPSTAVRTQTHTACHHSGTGFAIAPTHSGAFWIKKEDLPCEVMVGISALLQVHQFQVTTSPEPAAQCHLLQCRDDGVDWSFGYLVGNEFSEQYVAFAPTDQFADGDLQTEALLTVPPGMTFQSGRRIEEANSSITYRRTRRRLGSSALAACPTLTIGQDKFTEVVFSTRFEFTAAGQFTECRLVNGNGTPFDAYGTPAKTLTIQAGEGRGIGR